MKIAVLSDIHGNLEAATTCLEFIDTEKKIDAIVVLGDFVGYGANPNECISLFQDRMSFGVIGNHDSAVLGVTGIIYFNILAQEALFWTKTVVSDEAKKFLSTLPYSVRKDDLLFTHASPGEPKEWHYIFNLEKAKEHFKNFTEKICFIGHTHTPAIYSEQEEISHNNGAIALDKSLQYIINVGSIGQPRDGNPELSFGTFDTDNWEFEIIRLAYDAKLTGEKIIEAGLPVYLSERLLLGK